MAMRISIVLGKDGGAFPVMRRLTKLGLGGKQGPGTQWISCRISMTGQELPNS